MTGKRGGRRGRKRHKSGKRAAEISAENERRDARMLVFCAQHPPDGPSGRWDDGHMNHRTSAEKENYGTEWGPVDCRHRKKAKEGAVRRESAGECSDETRGDGFCQEKVSRQCEEAGQGRGRCV